MRETLKEILTGPDPVTQLKKLHAQGLLGELEPALANLKMDIPKGYHHKDNLTHSLTVLQNAIDRETDGVDLILRTAALLHDIGKPATRAFGEAGVVTFTNHDTVGGKQARRILPKHGYSKEDTDSIARLITLHMRSHTFKTGWSESAVRRLAVDAGSNKQLERLIIIFYSDATTKFDDKKEALHASVTELSNELVRVQAADARKALRPALNGLEVAELLGIKPGPELKPAMTLLNQDENIGLNREQAIALLKAAFQ